VRRAVLKSGPVAWPPGQGAGALPGGEGLDRPLFLPGMGGWGKVWTADGVGCHETGEGATDTDWHAPAAPEGRG
jgi:hypothetical protein